MPFITEIKERITSTADTRKITQSLQLVAASKMKGFVHKALATREYTAALLDALALAVSEDVPLPYSESYGEAPLFVLITSDRGLCGNLNQKLIKFLLAHPEWSVDAAVVVVGKKGEDGLRRRGVAPLLSFPAISERISPVDALRIVAQILDIWKKGKAGKVYLICPHYVNPFLSNPTVKLFLPFSMESVVSDKESPDESYQQFRVPPVTEPSGERVATMLVTQLIEALFTTSFYELKAAEYSSRMVAMKKASDAAEELIEDLTGEYNKLRQERITNQLAELATAAEAMNEEGN